MISRVREVWQDSGSFFIISDDQVDGNFLLAWLHTGGAVLVTIVKTSIFSRSEERYQAWSGRAKLRV